MNKARLEAFTDGVIAIIMTLMVFGIKHPAGTSFADLWAMRNAFFIYFISFATLALYWYNHHHVFTLFKEVTGKIILWNTLLLLCVSLFPFVTAWAEENPFARVPEMTYGFAILSAHIFWLCLNLALLR